MFFTKINETTPDSQKFLQITRYIAQPVKRLWFIGKLPDNRDSPVVAIVGTRKPTPYGKEMAYRLSYDLAKRGVIVISGLALGVDGIAHRAALDAGGTTITVQANGLDRLYPSSHRELGREIVRSGGAILSEYSPGTVTYKNHFLERNRIVSGLSDGVLVIEAASRSGTLATANFALDQGRAVMAVPGNAGNPMSSGCNKLIKSGAALIETANDVFEALGLTDETTQTTLPLADNAEEKILLDLLLAGVHDGEELQQKSQLPAAKFSQTLSMLEITGRVKSLGANRWSLR